MSLSEIYGGLSDKAGHIEWNRLLHGATANQVHQAEQRSPLRVLESRQRFLTESYKLLEVNRRTHLQQDTKRHGSIGTREIAHRRLLNWPTYVTQADQVLQFCFSVLFDVGFKHHMLASFAVIRSGRLHDSKVLV